MPQEQVVEPHKTPRTHRSVVAWVLAAAGLLVVLLLVGAAVLLQVLFATAKARIQSEACAERMKKIGIALQSYHDEYNAWPPAVVADPNGRPMHTWRVLILPQLGVEEEKLYKRYHFDEPWDGPNNRDLADLMPEVYGCPLDPAADLAQTSFLAIVDSATGDFATHPTLTGAGPSTGPAPPKPQTPLMVVEVAESKVIWMEPKDLVLGGKQARWHAAKQPAELSYHVGRSHALLDDLTADEIADDQVWAALG
ncbi:MAG TPA: DUF1559 domain-containing protein, partial [Pirellulales bacterium]|nr:DUF1559 domain-containing protein [Pirellulales bacterium]